MNDPVHALSLSDVLAKVTDQWAPRTIARVNDYAVRVVKIEGAYDWHTHAETDEFFMCVRGEFTIQVRYETGVEEVRLRTGEVYVVPKGVPHRPVAETEAHILLVEPESTVATGD